MERPLLESQVIVFVIPDELFVFFTGDKGFEECGMLVNNEQ